METRLIFFYIYLIVLELAVFLNSSITHELGHVVNFSQLCNQGGGVLSCFFFVFFYILTSGKFWLLISKDRYKSEWYKCVVKGKACSWTLGTGPVPASAGLALVE